MSIKENTPRIALPRGWNENVKSAMLHVISLAQFGMAYTHGWAANSINSRIRLKAKCERLRQQVAQLTEEIRIKDARMARLDARNRPHYPATERMAILLLRAVQKFLDRTIQKNGAKPKYIVTDKGSQFWCDGFKGWRQDQDDHTPLWRRRQARKHCRGRTLHSYPEGRIHTSA